MDRKYAVALIEDTLRILNELSNGEIKIDYITELIEQCVNKLEDVEKEIEKHEEV